MLKSIITYTRAGQHYRIAEIVPLVWNWLETTHERDYPSAIWAKAINCSEKILEGITISVLFATQDYRPEQQCFGGSG